MVAIIPILLIVGLIVTGWLLMCRLNKRPKPAEYAAFVDETMAVYLAIEEPASAA